MAEPFAAAVTYPRQRAKPPRSKPVLIKPPALVISGSAAVPAGSAVTCISSAVISNIVWGAWNTEYAFSVASGAATLNAWSAWNTEYVNSTGSATTMASIDYDYGVAPGINYVSNDTIWAVWAVWNDRFESAVIRKPTPEEMERMQQQRAEQERLAAERLQKAKLAKQRARNLLVSLLEKGQRQSFEKDRYFIVHSRDGQRRYKVTQGRSGNVFLLDGKADKTLASFCIHPDILCPDEDTMLAQKLMLETDERAFLKIANHTILDPEGGKIIVAAAAA